MNLENASHAHLRCGVALEHFGPIFRATHVELAQADLSLETSDDECATGMTLVMPPASPPARAYGLTHMQAVTRCLAKINKTLRDKMRRVQREQARQAADRQG